MTVSDAFFNVMDESNSLEKKCRFEIRKGSV